MATAVFTTMGSSPGDPLHDLLVKAVYWAQSLAESSGGTLPTQIYPYMGPSANDSLHDLCAKLVYWLEAASSGTASGSGLQTGAANPINGVTPTSPAFYWNTATNTFWVYANGGWNAH